MFLLLAPLVSADPTYLYPPEAPDVVLELSEAYTDLGYGIRVYGNFTLDEEAVQTIVRRDDQCGGSSFENVSSGGSPTVGDCAALRDAAYGTGAGWAVGACGLSDNQHTSTCYTGLISRGTCIFGAANSFSNAAVRIGTSDVGDLTRDSINKFQLNGKVGSRGQTRCRYNDPNWLDEQVIWGLWHT